MDLDQIGISAAPGPAEVISDALLHALKGWTLTIDTTTGGCRVERTCAPLVDELGGPPITSVISRECASLDALAKWFGVPFLRAVNTDHDR